MDETTERLTRILALERMKKLSDMYVEGSKMPPTYETITQMNQINAERMALRDEFLKVVNDPRRTSDTAPDQSEDQTSNPGT